MRKDTVVGIDIGSYYVKVVVTEVHADGSSPPHIIGTGSSPSYGLRNGYITSQHEIADAIAKAVEQAQRESGVKIERAYLAIGGVGLEDIRGTGESIVSRADTEVTDTDAENAMNDAEHRITGELTNRQVIHAIPLGYRLDGVSVIGRVEGMRGSKLEVDALFITVMEQHLNDLIAAVESAGVETIDVMAAPIAASLVTLTKQQKVVGCILANIGAETVSIVIFEENRPLSLKVFPIGSSDITNDIALELRISLSEAEQLKRGVVTGSTIPQKRLDDIMTGKLRDMFGLIQAHLKEINRAGLLPAGVVLTGGGSGIGVLEDYARHALKLPAEVAGLHLGEQRLKDATWAVAYGLCIWGASTDADTIGINTARATGAKFLSWFKQFLP